MCVGVVACCFPSLADTMLPVTAAKPEAKDRFCASLARMVQVVSRQYLVAVLYKYCTVVRDIKRKSSDHPRQHGYSAGARRCTNQRCENFQILFVPAIFGKTTDARQFCAHVGWLMLS